MYVSEDSNSFTTGDLCGHYIGPGSQGDVITFECCPGRRGRYVRLQADYRNGWNLGGEENVLTLCEVEVY